MEERLPNTEDIKMFKKETLRQIRLPALFMFAATVLCALSFGYADGIGIVFLFIQQLFALITCYAFVIVRNRGRVHVWVNYIFWFLMLNIGSIAEAVGWKV